MQCPSEDGNVGWALGLSQLILGLSWAGLGTGIVPAHLFSCKITQVY